MLYQSLHTIKSRIHWDPIFSLSITAILSYRSINIDNLCQKLTGSKIIPNRSSIDISSNSEVSQCHWTQQHEGHISTCVKLVCTVTGPNSTEVTSRPVSSWFVVQCHWTQQHGGHISTCVKLVCSTVSLDPTARRTRLDLCQAGL